MSLFSRRSFLGFSIPVLSSFCFFRKSGFAAAGPPPDRIFFGGKVLSVDRDFRIAQAFAVSGNRILAVGSDAEVLALAGPRTERVDLAGKTVMPGIIDSHAHPVAAAMYELDHEIPGMETLAEVLAYFQSRTAVVPKGDWIGLQQVFITRLREKRYPSRTELDSATPEHPAFMRTGPDAMLNSLALAKFNITKDSGDHPDSGLGMIERDPATNEPTGMLRNCTAVGNFLVPDTGKTNFESQKAQMRKLFAAYNSVGITTTSDRNALESDIALYQALRDAGELSCRVYAYHEINSKLSSEEIEAKVKRIANSPVSKKDDFLWVGGVKMFLDGGMLTGSARMREPWGESPIYKITDPEYKGMLFIPEEKLTRFARAAVRSGMQPSVHCVGDGALEVLVRAYAEVDKEIPVKTVRPGICHGNFMFPEAIETIGRIGAVVDMQPAWLYLDGATLRDHFGEKRLKWFQPYRTLLDKKIAIGGGSDHMLKIDPKRAINLYDPFLGIETMLTRMPRWTDAPLTPEQRITREEAIRFYTIDSAFVLRSEADKGSLEPGKLADFIILDRDILRCPVEALHETKVLETWLDGRRV